MPLNTIPACSRKKSTKSRTLTIFEIIFIFNPFGFYRKINFFFNLSVQMKNVIYNDAFVPGITQWLHSLIIYDNNCFIEIF